jgi:methionyl-tRNA formyltransferase
VTIYFFTGTASIGQLAFDIATVRHPEHAWRKLVLETHEKQLEFESERHVPELIVSFLNPYIVPATLIDAVHGRAYNVHPSLPAYPGNDPPHFAAYDGCFVAGATVHLMEPAVDCGPICDVWEQPVDPAEGVTRLRELSLHMSVGILLADLGSILAGTLKPNGRAWSVENRHSRADFLEKCRIDPEIETSELERRLRAFHHPGYRNQPFVEIHGHRFVYDPDREAPP